VVSTKQCELGLLNFFFRICGQEIWSDLEDTVVHHALYFTTHVKTSLGHLIGPTDFLFVWSVNLRN